MNEASRERISLEIREAIYNETPVRASLESLGYIH